MAIPKLPVFQEVNLKKDRFERVKSDREESMNSTSTVH